MNNININILTAVILIKGKEKSPLKNDYLMLFIYHFKVFLQSWHRYNILPALGNSDESNWVSLIALIMYRKLSILRDMESSNREITGRR